MQRTDTHSPRNIDPAEYVYVGSFVANPPVGPEGEIMVDEDMLPGFEPYGDDTGTYTELLAASPSRPREFLGQCDHCGAYINYHAVYQHTSGDHIAVGHDCADNTLGWSDRRSLDLARQKKATEAARKNVEEERKRRENIERTRELFPEAVELLLNYDGPNDFIRDVSGRFTRFGTTRRVEDGDYSVQLKVMNAVLAAHHRDLVREGERAQAADVPEGRIVIDGEVISIKEKENDYGVRWVMTVKHDDGWLVWGTVPSAILDDVDRGDRVKFKGTVKQSDRDSKFGFFSRPASAEIVKE